MYLAEYDEPKIRDGGDGDEEVLRPKRSKRFEYTRIIPSQYIHYNYSDK